MNAITGVQASLARKAKEVKTHRFGDLWSLICREQWIHYALDHVLTNTGSKTAGIDGTTRKQFKEEADRTCFIRELQAELKGRTFKPEPVRRIYIPKANGKLRPLGIPTVKDRTVQMLLKMALEPIWESDFLDCSSGFRIGRRTMDSIWAIYRMTYPRPKMYWAIEGDIKGYFDNIHHQKLMELVAKRIQDERVLRLIEQFLSAGVMEQQLFKRTEAGTPQGGIVSPLLANIYLHELDCYWRDNHNNLTSHGRRVRRMTHQGNNHLIRYADDFLLLTNGSKAAAEQLSKEFGDFLREELKLELSPEKTLLTHVNDGYNFLGYHIRRYTNPRGGDKPVVLIKPSEKGIDSYKDKVRALTATDRIANPLDTLRAYNRLASGWGHYYRYVNAKDILSELDHWAFNRLLFWFARHHGVGPRQAWGRYVVQQTGRQGTMRKNLAVKDDQGGLTFCFRMADLEVRRYHRPVKDNPYLAEGGETSISEADTPTLEASWTGNTNPDHARYREERMQKLEEAEYRCERCGNRENLDLHHLKPAKGRDRTKLHHPPQWTMILCGKCHAATSE